MIRGILVAAALACAGCPSEPLDDEIGLARLTAAPPATIATITTEIDDISIELTHGVAIAARCWDTCDSTCQSPTITSDDPTILGVRPVYRPNDTADADIVLVASTPGTTSLRVRSACAAITYPVTIRARD